MAGVLKQNWNPAKVRPTSEYLTMKPPCTRIFLYLGETGFEPATPGAQPAAGVAAELSRFPRTS